MSSVVINSLPPPHSLSEPLPFVNSPLPFHFCCIATVPLHNSFAFPLKRHFPLSQIASFCCIFAPSLFFLLTHAVCVCRPHPYPSHYNYYYMSNSYLCVINEQRKHTGILNWLCVISMQKYQPEKYSKHTLFILCQLDTV